MLLAIGGDYKGNSRDVSAELMTWLYEPWNARKTEHLQINARKMGLRIGRS